MKCCASDELDKYNSDQLNGSSQNMLFEYVSLNVSFQNNKQLKLINDHSVPAKLGKGQGAKEIVHNLARERPKFGHNLLRKRHKIFYT